MSIIIMKSNSAECPTSGEQFYIKDASSIPSKGEKKTNLEDDPKQYRDISCLEGRLRQGTIWNHRVAYAFQKIIPLVKIFFEF